MYKIFEPFKCYLHHDILSEEFCREHSDLFPAAYLEAAPMAIISVELARALNTPLIMLPFDYVAEAEAYGAKLIGYDDIFGLRTEGQHLRSIEELSELPPLSFTQGRLSEIIKAISLIDASEYTPCLNITGPFSLLELLLPIERVFSAWRKRQNVLLEFIASYEESLLEYITLAMNAGAKVISYSDPLTGLSLIGRKNGRQMAEELILPFFHDMARIPHSGVIHVCGISSDILTAADADWQEVELETEKYYSQAIIEQACSAQGIRFFGYGCLHQNKATKNMWELIIGKEIDV
jgi:uroporphyrinogen-III decarboxylase